MCPREQPSLSGSRCCSPAATARAQSGGAYDLRHNTIDGGGATGSFGGAYKLGGTIGQPDAGRLSGGAYSLSGGFWAGIQVVDALPRRPASPRRRPPRSRRARRRRALRPRPWCRRRTPSNTANPSPIQSPTRSPTQTTGPSNTPNPSPSQSPTGSPTPTTGPSDTPTATPTPSPTESPRVTPAAVCVGDCDLDDAVTIAELLRMVNIALGDAAVDTCEAGDPNHDQAVTINEILQAVSNALAGCG